MELGNLVPRSSVHLEKISKNNKKYRMYVNAKEIDTLTFLSKQNIEFLLQMKL